MLRGSAIGDAAFSYPDLLEYRQAFSRPDAATVSLSYYRAAFRDILVGCQTQIGPAVRRR